MTVVGVAVTYLGAAVTYLGVAVTYLRVAVFYLGVAVTHLQVSHRRNWHMTVKWLMTVTTWLMTVITSRWKPLDYHSAVLTGHLWKARGKLEYLKAGHWPRLQSVMAQPPKCQHLQYFLFGNPLWVHWYFDNPFLKAACWLFNIYRDLLKQNQRILLYFKTKRK